MPTTVTIQGATIAGYLGVKVDPEPNSTYTLTGKGPDPLAPIIMALSPSSVVAGMLGFTLSCIGAQFASGAIMAANGVDMATTFVSANQVHAPLDTAAITTPKIIDITVRNADGKTSEPFGFEVTASA